MIIGICGKSGSSKSTLTNQTIESANNKAIHLDIDSFGHQVLLLPDVQELLVQYFGHSILNDKTINRKELGDIVFNSRNEMNKLSDIPWKYMQLIIDDYIDKNKDKMIILDWILKYY